MIQFPQKISPFHNTTHFRLEGHQLEEPPIRLLTYFPNLQGLYLGGDNYSHCSPSIFEDCEHLEFVSFFGEKLANLPKSLQELKNLKKIELYKLKELISLPTWFGSLSSIRFLSLTHLPLIELPNTLKGWTALEKIRIENITLNSLPDSLCDCEQLRTLEIHSCPNLKSLPATLGMLPRLEKIYINNCPNLGPLPESLADAPSLKEVELIANPKMTATKAFQERLAQRAWNVIVDGCGKGWYLNYIRQVLPPDPLL